MKKSVSFSISVCITLGIALVFIGCASIMGGGTKQEVQISSSPTAAQIKIERSGVMGRVAPVWEGTTPASPKLKRKYEYLITISLEGYQPVEIPLEQGTNGWVWGNLLCGGIIGLIVDFSNGAAKKLEPEEVSVQLVSAMGLGPEEKIYVVLHTLDENGDLRVLPVPLIPDNNYLTAR